MRKQYRLTAILALNVIHIEKLLRNWEYGNFAIFIIPFTKKKRHKALTIHLGNQIIKRI